MNGTIPKLVRLAPTDPLPGNAAALPARVLEALADAVVVVDGTGRIQLLNPAGERLLARRFAQVRGRPLSDCLMLRNGTDGHLIPSPLAHLLGRDTRPAEHYDLLVRPDGREIPIETVSALLSGLPGEASGIVILLRDATDTCAAIRRLNERTTRDDLTRLVNRGEFERRLACRVERLCAGEMHALLYMDLDGFKGVNDAAGHAAGDAALQLVAKVFQATVRERDTLARLGGDEFALLLEHCPADLALRHAAELKAALANTEFRWNGHCFRLGVSIGLAMIGGCERRTTDEILTEADLACYAAKRGSRVDGHGNARKCTEGTQGGDAAGFALRVLPRASVANKGSTNA